MNNETEIKPGKTALPVLVVIDDEEPILTALRSLFRKDGYKMHFFSSGSKALEFLKQNHANVIVTDMRMPEMSGSQLLENSIKISPDAIRIIISGYEEKSVILNAISQGLARHYVMKPWDDEQLRAIVGESMKLQQKLRQKQLNELLLSFCNLPSPPRLHNRLKQILQQDQKSQKEIASEIEKSPALVAKLLRISNSIFYGTRKPISNVFDALTFIGTESVLNIVLSLESFDNISYQANYNIIPKADEIRLKSVQRAQVAREIALQWDTKTNLQEAYVAGLMLDIGLVLRFCSSSKKFEVFNNTYLSTGKPVFNIDKEIYITTHDEVGEALLDYWNFSPEIVTSVANHHRYANNDALTTIVQIADMLIQGNDSLPHDPCIDGLAKEWTIKLSNTLQRIRNTEII